MNDYDFERMEDIRNDICCWLDDPNLGDELRRLINKLYEQVDEFITDVYTDRDEEVD